MRKKRWIEREKLDAVHDDDLEALLTSLGILDEIKVGKHHCIVCGVQITLDNLGAIYPKGKIISFICDRVACSREIIVTEKELNHELD